jgi:hypothetical protein
MEGVSSPLGWVISVGLISRVKKSSLLSFYDVTARLTLATNGNPLGKESFPAVDQPPVYKDVYFPE